MATIIEKIGNYIVLTDSVTLEPFFEYPSKDVKYVDTPTHVILQYIEGSKTTKIGKGLGYTLADLLQVGAVAFLDRAAMLLWLRTNTGA